MRILMTTDAVGGVWNFTATLCEALCVDHEVVLVSFGPPPSQSHRDWVRGMEGRRFHFLACEVPLEWMPENDRAFAGSEILAQIAAQFRPDVLHTNQFCWGALPREGALDIPRVISAHSDVLSWGEACRPGGFAPSAWLDRYVRLVQSGLDGADALVAPTRCMLDALRANFVLRGPCVVIHNGVAGTVFTLKPRKRQIITAGRFWDEGKNLKLLQHLDSPFAILCAGDGVPEGDVRSLGALSRRHLMRQFQESEIYLCPSLYEPFGLAPLEAAASGCALVLHDIPSLREVWGDAAFYFSDRPGLEVLLTKLWLEPEAVRQAALRAVERAAEFSLARTVGGYLSVCSSVAKVQSERGQLAHA